MKVFGREKVYKFIKKHAEVRSQAQSWVAFAEAVSWHSPSDVKAWDASASILRDNCVIFDLSDQYRLKVRIAYKNQSIFILEIGKHSEYEKWR